MLNAEHLRRGTCPQGGSLFNESIIARVAKLDDRLLRLGSHWRFGGSIPVTMHLVYSV